MGLLRNIIGYGLSLRQLAKPRNKSELSQRDRLTNIIRHANTHCPYYKNAYDAFLEGEKDFSQEEFDYAFSHLPVINKNTITSHGEEFFSDELKNKKPLFNNETTPSLQQLLKSCFYEKDFVIPLTMSNKHQRWIDYHDARTYLNSLFSSLRKNGWKYGENIVLFMPENNNQLIKHLTKHNALLYHLIGLTIIPFKEINQQSVTHLLSILKNTKASTLITCPHALLRVAHIMHEENIAPYDKHLHHINLSGSYFLDCSKTFIYTMFPQSDIQCSYNTTKCGAIAHQSSLDTSCYKVFDDKIYLEQGPGNSIIITTYNQKAFPLIRYDTGDIGRIINHNDGSQEIHNLEGPLSSHLIGADGYMYFPSFFNIFINEINKELNDPIIDFALCYKNNDKSIPSHLDLTFILSNPTKKDKIRKTALEVLGPVFANYKIITASFPHHIEHDFSQKHQIIASKKENEKEISRYKKFEKIQPDHAQEQNTEKHTRQKGIIINEK